MPDSPHTNRELSQAQLETIRMIYPLFKNEVLRRREYMSRLSVFHNTLLVFLIMIIMSWLINFNVINTRNDFVAAVWRVLNAITEPILRPIRRIIPPMGGFDLSPIVVFVIIFFLQNWIASIAIGRVI